MESHHTKQVGLSSEQELARVRAELVGLSKREYLRYRLENLDVYEALLRASLNRPIKNEQDLLILRQAVCWSESDVNKLIQKLRLTSQNAEEQRKRTDTTQSLFPNWAWYNDPTLHLVQNPESWYDYYETNKERFWLGLGFIVFIVVSMIVLFIITQKELGL